MSPTWWLAGLALAQRSCPLQPRPPSAIKLWRSPLCATFLGEGLGHHGGTVPTAVLGPILVLEVLCAVNHHLSLLDTAWITPPGMPSGAMDLSFHRLPG